MCAAVTQCEPNPFKPSRLQDTHPPHTSIIAEFSRRALQQRHIGSCVCVIDQSAKTLRPLACCENIAAPFIAMQCLAPGIYICYPAKHSCRLMTLPKKQGLALQWLQILPKTMTKSHISIGSTIEGMCHNEPDPPGKPQEPEDILPKSRAVPEPPEELRPCPER